MRNVVFLVKNGIGFGHIRRAVLLAEALHSAGRVRPIIISQASSLSLYRDTPVDVVNFPLLHRVASAVAEDCYTAILDQLLDRLDPALIIEDTYPDPRYLALGALADRPRLLIMRRLDGLSFDQLRTQGRFVTYDEILIAQDPEDFGREGHSGESLTAVHHAGRFSFVGNLSYIPTAADVDAVRGAYALHSEQLVVVNGGAGGDQMPDGYGDRLFTACATVAERIRASGHPARFVFVTGPYYAGSPLAETPNVSVRQFEPRLAALLAAADVAVIKPGNNALSEALLGQAHLVLVPDVSFMEGLDEHAARVAEHYGGTVIDTDPDLLEIAIRTGLHQPPRTQRTQPNHGGILDVVNAVHRHVEQPAPALAARRLLLLLVPPIDLHPGELRQLLPAEFAGAVIVDELPDGDCAIASNTGLAFRSELQPQGILLDDGPPDATPQTLVDQGVQLIISHGRAVPDSVRRWLRLAPPSPSLTLIGSTTIRAAAGRATLFPRRVAAVLEAPDPVCLVLDLAGLSDDSEIQAYLGEVSRWWAGQPAHLAGPGDLVARHAQHLLEAN